MKRAAMLTVLIVLIAAQTGFPQTPSPLSFFPHHQGDIWEYVNPYIPGPYVQNIITSDTIGPDGRFYLNTTMRGRMLVDTSLLEVRSNIWGGTYYGNLTYKLDADVGHSWIVVRSSGFTLVARVHSIFQSVVFGQLVTVKQINYTDSASGLLLDTDYLAANFGLIGQDNDAMPYRRLRGAIINGVQYGMVTVSAPELYSDLPITAMLHQNFPNPFNPVTTITFELPRGTHVDLSVFDLLGRRLTTLLDEYRYPGPHSVRFNGEGLASGVYLYRLRTREQTITKRMMLIR